MKKLLGALALASAMATLQPAFAADSTIKIALVHGLSGSPLETYSKQTTIGFNLGLEYATKGTMTIKGRKIEVIEKDTQFKPDVARTMLEEAYNDDGALLAVGGTSSGVATAMLPIAAENQKVLIIEPAVADSLTGPDSNRYVFKTSRNSSQDMQAQALALKPDKDLYIATLAQDYAFGKDGIGAFKTALKGSGAHVVDEEYVPIKTTDFTATIQRMFDALRDKPGRRVIVVYVAGVDALTPLVAADPGRYKIDISTGGNILPVMKAYKQVPGMEGAIYYYYGIPKNPINDWLVKEHEKRYHQPPDFFTAGGMAAALAVAKAIETSPDLKTDSLIKTMEGMTWDTPKGPMTFRKEDHQALQEMYHFKIKVDPKVEWAIPELVSVIEPDQMHIPIGRNDQK